MAQIISLEVYKRAVQTAFLEYSLIDDDETLKALNGKIHRTFSDLGMDSLDIVEIIMMVEDEIGAYFDDAYLELHNCNPSMLVEGFAEFLFRAPNETY